MQHLEEGTIHAWLDGALSGDEAEHVEAHVRQCAECAAAVGEARGLIAGASRIVSALDVVPGGVIPRPTPAPPAAAAKSTWRVLHFTPLRAAIAATLLVAVGSMFVLPYAVPHGEKRTPSVAAAVDSAAIQQIVVATAAPPATTPATTPAARVLPPSAPPTQKQAQAADQSGRATEVANAQKQETRTADAPSAEKAVADAAGFVARDSARGVVSDSTRAVAGGRAMPAIVAAEVGRRDLRSAPMRLREQAEPALAMTGCFRAAEDPARLGIALPQRFSLDRDTSGTVVRKLDDAGRADSVVGGWRPLSATSVLITLDNREPRGAVSLTQDRSGAITARSADLSAAAPSGSGVASRSVSVSRVECVR